MLHTRTTQHQSHDMISSSATRGAFFCAHNQMSTTCLTAQRMPRVVAHWRLSLFRLVCWCCLVSSMAHLHTPLSSVVTSVGRSSLFLLFRWRCLVSSMVHLHTPLSSVVTSVDRQAIARIWRCASRLVPLTMFVCIMVVKSML